MTRIEVNFDSDYVKIDKLTPISVKRPKEMLTVLEELLNHLELEAVELIATDEGRARTVGEW